MLIPRNHLQHQAWDPGALSPDALSPRPPCAAPVQVHPGPPPGRTHGLGTVTDLKSRSPLLAFPTSLSGDSARFRAENVREHHKPLRAVLRTRSPWSSATGPSTSWRKATLPPLKTAKSQTRPWDCCPGRGWPRRRLRSGL